MAIIVILKYFTIIALYFGWDIIRHINLKLGPVVQGWKHADHGGHDLGCPGLDLGSLVLTLVALVLALVPLQKFHILSKMDFYAWWYLNYI